MSYALGVDLGTSFTAVAVARDGHAEMLSLGERTVVAPSVVFAAPDGRLVSGDGAARRGAAEPARAAREFKRRLGDPTPFILGDATYSPAALMAATLTDVIATATRVLGGPPAEVVLSRPAVWGPYRLEQFDEVPRLAGLDGVHLVAEPVAAATHYAATRATTEGDVVAVYDLGGGTFDTAVLRLHAGEMSILGVPEGVEWLGGADFDEAVLGYVDRELKGAVGRLDPREPEAAVALTRLRTECVLAKEALSFDEETTIPVFLPGVREQVTLTRAKFEEMIGPAVGSTVDAMKRALKSAGLTPADLSAVLLVGGSSRIPAVARLVGEALQRPTVVNAHPKHAVALGAAEIAGRLTMPVASPPASPAPGPAPSATEKPDPLAAAVTATDAPPRPTVAVAQHLSAPAGSTTAPAAHVAQANQADQTNQRAETAEAPATAVAVAPGPAVQTLERAEPRRTVGNHRYRGTTRGSAGLRGDEALHTAMVLLVLAVVVVVVAGVLGTLWGRAHRTAEGYSAGVTVSAPIVT